jgi:DnaK suppressor protein
MRKTDLMRYRRTLEGQLAALAQQGAATVHGLTSEKEELPDPNDRATREEDLREELRLRDRDRKLASKIEEALSRIEAGTFGLCASCGGRIDPARLRARPVTALCIDCKREAEQTERRV